MGRIRLTYKYAKQKPCKQVAFCCLCRQEAELQLTPRKTRVKVNHLILLGNYEELIVQCPMCNMEYLASADLSHALIPSKFAKIMFWIAVLLMIVPFLNVALQLVTLRLLPKTSNFHRQWAKIFLMPAVLISLIMIFIFVILNFA